MSRKVILTTMLICLVLALFFQIAFAAESIKLPKIAVTGFETKGNHYFLSLMATDLLTSDLTRMKSCQVVERDELNRVLKEQQLNATGIISPGSAIMLGGILGLDYLLTGTVSAEQVQTREGYYYYKDNKRYWMSASYTTKAKVIIKLTDARNGEIVWSEQREIEHSSETRNEIDIHNCVEEATYDVARRLYESYMPLKGYVIDKQGNKFVIDLGEDQNIKKGTTFLIKGVVSEYRHPITGELIQDVKNKGKLKVVEVSSRTCIAEYKEGNDMAKIMVGDIVSKEICKKPKDWLGFWSGKHEF